MQLKEAELVASIAPRFWGGQGGTSVSDIHTCLTTESLDGCSCGPGLQWKCEGYEREYMLGKEERGIEIKLVFANVNTCGATGETFEADP